jgi:molybdate transport system substrate-binding protein
LAQQYPESQKSLIFPIFALSALERIDLLMCFRFLKLTLILLLILFASCPLTGCHADNQVTLIVAAGTGLTDALAEVNDLYSRQKEQIRIETNFAAAGDLQTQIENGAPVDIFFSAATSQMDALEQKALILKATRKNVVANKLVLITHQDNQDAIDDFSALKDGIFGLMAIGDPEFVPAGAYALEAFKYVGISYEALKPNLILGNNVRQVLNYVENKSVDYGIVYYTDTVTSDLVKIVAIAPEEINRLVIFPVAVVAASNHPEQAIAYIDSLFSPQAKAIFKKYGFITLRQPE